MRSLIIPLAHAVVWSGLIVFTILLVRGFDARRMGELKRWHRLELQAEFTADMAGGMSFEDYLVLETRLFEELDDKLIRLLSAEERGRYNRYDPLAYSHAGDDWAGWNRTVVLEPAGRATGGVLLLHGLTDSPYSMRAVAELFHARGFYVVALRLPGMGTVPAAARSVRWQDWSAAARLAADDLVERLGEDGGPFYIGGYSNGGLLAVQYAIAAAGHGGRVPDRLFLFAPAIGVTRFAAFSDWHKLLSWIPYFENLAWGEIHPEYDPFKYTSFPKDAGRQGYLLSRVVGRELARLVRSGGKLPPMLTFQSVVDATVSTPAVVEMYESVAAPGSELVLFDINRYSHLQVFLRDVPKPIAAGPAPPYELCYVTNRDPEALEVVAERRGVGGRPPRETLLLAWPAGVYSLSHVAIPFGPEDPFYGAGTDPDPERLTLGSVQPRGERGVLTVPVENLMRLRYNPFFDYVVQRTLEFCPPCSPPRQEATRSR